MNSSVESPGAAAPGTRATMVLAGLAAGLAFAFTRSADTAVASKRTKRIKTERCKPQVQQCLDSLTAACNGDPTCLENLTCCDLFATCDAAAGVSCIFGNAN